MDGDGEEARGGSRWEEEEGSLVGNGGEREEKPRPARRAQPKVTVSCPQLWGKAGSLSPIFLVSLQIWRL